MIYILEVVFAISFTALVYTNELASYLPFAIGFTLLGDAALCAIVAAFSSYRGASAVEEDVPAAILTLTVAAVLAALPAGTHPDTKFATVLMVVVLTTTTAGVFFLLLGYFKLGGLARFLPYPVMGGFLAGTGDTTLPPARFVVLDFARVTGLDSTALLSFDKMLALTEELGIILVLTGLSGPGVQHVSIHEQLTKGGFTARPEVLRFFPDLDHGIEWCEEQIIAGARLETEEQGLADYFAAIVPAKQMRQISRYMERQEFAAGEYVTRQGDESDDLFFIESGQIASQIENPGQKPLRLETMCGGRTVGELGFYLGTKRSAAVVADEASVTYRLTRRELDRMEQIDPQAALAFHRLIVHLLGDRAIHLMRSVQALQR